MMAQYWYNVQTHEVEKDAQSGWKSLIGPYESRAEAEQALAKVRERNELADAQEDDDEDA
ncbi:SPOR domain-containing protein [Arthrobacter psychrolactophilus]